MLLVYIITILVPVFGFADVKELPIDPQTTISPCVRVAELSQSLLAQKVKGKNISEKKRVIDKKAMGPPTKKEIQRLIRSMKPVNLKSGQGKRMKDLVIEDPLGKVRLQVLLQDAALLLTEIHIQEALDQIRNLDGINKSFQIELQDRLQDTLKAFNHCAEARFFHHGGSTALEQSRALVNQHRAELEEVIIRGRGTEIFLPPLYWLQQEGGP
jgi:hypothetical protein